MQNLDALAAAVSEEMERQNLNVYEVAERATQKGFKIVHGTVWNLLNKQNKEVKDKTVIAISRGLGIPEEKLFSIIRGRSLEDMQNDRFNRLAAKYDQLLPEDKEKLEPFLIAVEQTIALALPTAAKGSCEKVEVRAKSGKKEKEKEIKTSGGRTLKLVEGGSKEEGEK